jgi:predicted dehydrogenase
VSYCDQWREFARSIRTGTPMEATLQDGRQALAAVLAAARSSVVGRPVPLRDAPATMTLPPGKGRVQAAS